MNSNTRTELYHRACEKWGLEEMQAKAIEELCEAARALVRFAFGTVDPQALSDLIDELADARIVVEEMEYLLGLETAVVKRMETKLRRLEKKVAR